ncbi:MAG: DUF1007 family protein [Pseudomonadota bacterium]
MTDLVPVRFGSVVSHHLAVAMASLVLLLSAAGLALAHPHVFVDARATIVFNDQNAMVGVRHQWTFDEFFSAYAIEGLDADGDGTYSRAELAELAEINVTSLEAFGYFTFAGPEDEVVEFGRPRDYWLDHDDGLLVLNYMLPFARPILMGAQPVFVDIYDPEYFVAFGLVETDPIATDAMPEACSFVVNEPEGLDPTVEMMLADIGIDAQVPPELQVYTRALANRVVFTCDGDVTPGVAPTSASDDGGATRPFGVALPSTGFGPNFGGPLQPLFDWVAVQQRSVYRGLAATVQAFRDDPSSGLLLIGMSFIYGLLHAAGPGHGKAVISSYVLANKATVRRGVVLAFLSAALQGAMALAVVGVLAGLIGATSGTMSSAAAWLEIASFALISLLGAWMLIARLRAYVFPRRVPHPVGAAVTDHDGHHHHHGHHHHKDDAATCGVCGHAHMPSAEMAAAPMTFRNAWSAVLAVGLRPCSGAILVLVFCISQGLWWLGVGSVFAMALGTAVTVSVLAALAVGARDIAVKIAGEQSRAGYWVSAGIEILAASFVLLLGVLLLGGALSGGVPVF